MLCVTATAAFSQASFPDRVIRLVVPYPAGGIGDVIARIVADHVSQEWKQPIIIDAKPGGNSNIGTTYVANSPPDGYTWLATGPAVLVNPTLQPDAKWVPMRDFKLAGVTVWSGSVIVVPESLPVNSLKEFIDKAKAQPGRYNFGNAGAGTSTDLSARRLFRGAGFTLTDIGYKGQPPVILDLIAGRVDFAIVSLGLAMPHIKNGKIKALATFTNQRAQELPNIPTVAEAGYPDAYVSWFGIFVPAKTPQAVLDKIHAGIGRALEDPVVKERLVASKNIPGDPMALPDLAKLMQRDYDNLVPLVKP